jgi:hypothetical protein
MNTFLDALRECIGWNYNHTQPFLYRFPRCRSNLEDGAASPLRLFTADRRVWPRSHVFFAVRYFFASFSLLTAPGKCQPLLFLPEVLTSMNYSAMRHENLAIPVVFHDPLGTFASRNLIDTTKQFHRVTRLYGVQPVSGCCGRIEGFQKIPRGGSRGALTRIFPAVSPGRGGVVRGRLLGPVRRVNFFDPAARGLAADSI